MQRCERSIGEVRRIHVAAVDSEVRSDRERRRTDISKADIKPSGSQCAEANC